MTTTENEKQKVCPQHGERSAVVYLRQAVMPRPSETDALVARRNTLVERALSLGWSREHIMVIDEDIGRSANGHRPGFERLLSEVRLGRVGMVVCTEPSRLARSSTDWWSLVQACAAAGTLLCCLDRIDDAGSIAHQLRWLTSATTRQEGR
jgi:DNA invertase Pin-like site-specific DNA recombinase